MIVSIMTKHHQELSLIFQALADPTRRAILARLGGGPAPVMELFAPTGCPLPNARRMKGKARLPKRDGRATHRHFIPGTIPPDKT